MASRPQKELTPDAHHSEVPEGSKLADLLAFAVERLQHTQNLERVEPEIPTSLQGTVQNQSALPQKDFESARHSPENPMTYVVGSPLAGESEDLRRQLAPSDLGLRDSSFLEEALNELLPTVRNLFAFYHVSEPTSDCDQDHPKVPAFTSHQIGDFRLLAELGRGGMGVVYEAEQISLGRRVALKILSYPGRLDERQRLRFEAESRTAATLRHSHLVPVYLAGHEDGALYYAMQLIDGITLAQVIQRMQEAQSNTKTVTGAVSALSTLSTFTKFSTLSTSQDFSGLPEQSLTADSCGPQLPNPRTVEHAQFAARVIAEAASALDYAHHMGVVHRDIKPSNLMLDRTGWLWVTDFGLAISPLTSELTATGEQVGTARYMSPEQIAGLRGLIDQRTDVYSLGLTLHELLCLQPAFDPKLDSKLQKFHRFANPSGVRPVRKVAPWVPRDLANIVDKATQVDPSDRYQTAMELAEDLRRFLSGVLVLAQPPHLSKQVGRWLGRNRLKLGLTTAIALSLTIVAAAAWGVTHQALTQERRARAAEKARIRESHAIVQSTLLRLAGIKESQNPEFEPIRQEFLQRAENYLERFLQDHQNDTSFEQELACAVAQLAEIRRYQGRFTEAVPLYQEALQRYEQLMNQTPELYRSSYRQHLEQIRQALDDLRTKHPVARPKSKDN